MFSRRSFATSLALATLALCSGSPHADARRAKGPTTGLAPIAFGVPAPDFAFDRTEAPTSLAALRGRPVVVNFWAAYCAPCIDELPVFARLQRDYGDDVALVSVTDAGRDVADADLRALGVDAISVADPQRKIFTKYGVLPIPVTLVLAPDRTVSYVSIGELDWNELRTAVEAVRPT